jgi:DNA-binding transcriptional ArsR family regulator
MAAGDGNKTGDLFIALAHPLRRQILRKMLRDGQTSPRDLAIGLDKPLSALSYHVRVLAECGAIKLMRTKQIGGSTQHFYRPAVRAQWARTALQARERRQKKNRARGEEKS